MLKTMLMMLTGECKYVHFVRKCLKMQHVASQDGKQNIQKTPKLHLDPKATNAKRWSRQLAPNKPNTNPDKALKPSKAYPIPAART